MRKFVKIISIVLLVSLMACQSSFKEEQLQLAIKERNGNKAMQLLKSGVKLENDSLLILHLAIENRMEQVAAYLIRNGIDVNKLDCKGKSPVHLASMYGLESVVNALVKHGANLNFIDDAGYTPLNYAIVSGEQKVVKLLLQNGAVAFHDDLPDMQDGPFVDYVKDGMLAYYLVHDSAQGATCMKSALLPLKTTCFGGFYRDTLTYPIRKIKTPDWQVQTHSPVVVLGDIHGQYDRMITNLKDLEVIDEQLQWNFGKGHLVFVGDIFDRGSKVTEALWFIYKLELQAERAGGQVHLILGNHELLVLENDLRYVHRKYEKLAENTGLNHTLLFKQNSVLGEWICSKNTFLKLNDILFVHAGVSQKLLSKISSLDQINHLTRQYLYGGENPQNEEKLDLVMGSFGPFWYRGYIKARSKYERINASELDAIMKQLDVNTIVVGHTENDSITDYFDGKVIDVNIPLADPKIPNQALLIENGNFYHLSSGEGIRKIK